MSAASGTARRTTSPRLRHGFVAAALVVVAVLRLVEGDLVWATILGAAGSVEGGLAVAHRRAAAGPEPTAPASGWELPGAEVLERSLTRHQRNQRTWLAGSVLAAVAGASVVTAEPSVGLVLGVLSLGSLLQVRRERRSVVTLRQLVARSLTRHEGAA